MRLPPSFVQFMLDGGKCTKLRKENKKPASCDIPRPSGGVGLRVKAGSADDYAGIAISL
jgi:hypothetical protein